MMAGHASDNVERLERLQSLLNATLGPVQQLGPHGSAVAVPQWLKDFVLELLREIETSLPDPNYFKALIPSGKAGDGPSNLVTDSTNCWEIGILLNLARNAIGTCLGQPEGPFGFSPTGRSQSEK